MDRAMKGKRLLTAFTLQCKNYKGGRKGRRAFPKNQNIPRATPFPAQLPLPTQLWLPAQVPLHPPAQPPAAPKQMIWLPAQFPFLAKRPDAVKWEAGVEWRGFFLRSGPGIVKREYKGVKWHEL